MNWLNTSAILAVAFVAVFFQSYYRGIRLVFGAQIDVLPALMAYTALSCGLSTVVLLAVWGGLCFDALSANPLGTSMVPLFVAGAVIHYHRGLLLREQWVARYAIAFAACAVVPLLTVMLLLSMGHDLMLGYWSVWQWVVMALGGAATTPIWFAGLDWVKQALSYPAHTEGGFRPDREIKRGR